MVCIVRDLCGQYFAAFGAAPFNNKSSILGCHAGTKPVGAFAFDHAGLKCSLHGEYTGVRWCKKERGF